MAKMKFKPKQSRNPQCNVSAILASAVQGHRDQYDIVPVLLELTIVLKLKGNTSERAKRNARQSVHWRPKERSRTWLLWES